MIDDRYLTAVHEAGHCVVALSFGCTIIKVTIVPDPAANRAGVCTLKLAKGMSIAEKLAIDLAGAEATRQATMYRGKEYLEGIGSDVRDAAKLLHEHGGADHSAVLAESKQLARRIIGLSWGAVARIAERLVTHKVVSGPLATAIYVSHEIARRERYIA